MKGWLVALALTVVVGASGAGLWISWDATQTSSADPLVAASNGLVTTSTAGLTPMTTASTIPPAPPCEAGATPVDVDPEADWATAVIDTAHRVPEAYAPTDLVDVTEAGFEARDQVRAFVIDDLAALRAAAEANGTPVEVISGYRSFSYQQGLYDARVAEVGEAEAALRTARPGHSEHQLGTAIDVLDVGVGDLTTAFAATPAGQWIAEHAHEYGFVISYPDAARDRTCYEFEPWHLRYVGRENAAAIRESEATPREWMLSRAGDAG